MDPTTRIPERQTMRITFISPQANMAGGTRVIGIYAQHLQRLGHDVTIISPPPTRLPLKKKLKSLLTTGRWPLASARPMSHLDGIDVEHLVLDRPRPVTDGDVPDGDVVIATWWETAEWVHALKASKGAKAYFIQGHEIFPHLPVERVRATYRLPMHKIVIARWLKNVMKNEYGDDDVDLVPNSVDRSQFFASVRGKQPYPTVGFLYSTAPIKGLDVTLAAVRTVQERVPNLRGVCFGTERPTAERTLPNGIDFYYSPVQEALRDLYARCDTWITASRREGFNLPALEAMACRTPVVSTRAGWCEEAVVTGKNGVLVDVDDVAGLAKGVEWVLSQDDHDWRTLSANAHATASTGSWERSTTRFEQALLNARSKAGTI
jgi:glycosyltransferase involved in cell wall biosynthesis